MNLGVIGAGYVGLTTAICLATLGHKIIIFDINKKKLELILQKKLPFFEEGLEDLLKQVIVNENFVTSKRIKELVKQTDGCFICVGTPSRKDNSIDLSQIINSISNLAESISDCNKENYEIIVRSTVIPSTTKKIILPLLKETIPEKNFGLTLVPEFLREGQALSDFMNPDKIVIGYEDKQSKNFIEKIFECFKDKANFVTTNFETAEMIKYTNNAFFATLISFSNEIANISEKIKDVDTFEVMKALVSDKRIMSINSNHKIIPELVDYLLPGCGFGGSCFPKDINAITNFAQSIGTETPLLDAVLTINNERAEKIISLTESILKKISGKKIAILGLAFKPDTDDMRSSPAIQVIKKLQKMGAIIFAYDPKVSSKILKQLAINDVKLFKNFQECLKGVDLAILLTKWPEFKSINGDLLNLYMKKILIIDGRGFLDKKEFEKNTYFKVGYVEH